MATKDKIRVFQVNFRRSYLSIFNKPELIAAYGFGIILIGLLFIAETSFSNALISAVVCSGLSYYLLTPDEYGGEIKLLSLKRFFKRVNREAKFSKEIQLEIWDNAIFRYGKASVVLETQGINLRALGTEERSMYYQAISSAINALQINDLQIIVRKERAAVSDFIDHLRFVEHALSEHSGHKEKHATLYMENIANMLDSYWIHNTKTYLIISVPFREKSIESKAKVLSELTSEAEPFLEELQIIGIKTRQLSTVELTLFTKSFFK